MLFNPILASISNLYIMFWIAVVVLFVIDWSIGYDRVSNAVDKFFDFVGEHIPYESLCAPIMFTVIAMLCWILSIPFGSMFFGNFATGAGILAVGFIVIAIAFVVLKALLFALRSYCIERRAKKANAKNSLTDSE